MNKLTSALIKLHLFVIFLAISMITQAQEKSKNIQTINGKKYYIHSVEKGQSLYGIARVYGLDINTILAENDEAIDGIRNGQELKIPFESLLSKNSPSIDTSKYIYHKIQKGETVYSITKKYNLDEKKLKSYNPSLSVLKEGEFVIVGEKKKSKTPSAKDPIMYTVQQGETLYALSKKFNVSQEDIIKWNPEAKNGIKLGQVLKTYGVKTIEAVTPIPVVSIVKDSVIRKPKKNSYHVGLFLPFKFSLNETLNIDDLVHSKSFPSATSLSLDFYYGFKKAIDSLTTKDFDISIHVFDLDDKDSARAQAICKTDEFKMLDVIFGPLYSDEFKIISGHAKPLGIACVSPLTQQNRILFNNPLTSKINPSIYTLIEGLADYCSDSLMAASNMMIVNTTTKDQVYIKTFKDRYNENLSKYHKTLKDTVVEVKGLAGIKAAYTNDKKNVVVMLTNNPVYLQDNITQLSIFSTKKDIILMGFNSVSTIDNLDQDYLNDLQFHFATANHICYEDSAIMRLAKSYQEVFNTDPSENYFEGFDIAMYYLSNLKNQGPSVFLNLDKIYGKGVSTDFKFYRPDTETGFENRAISIYKYSNFKLQKVGWK